ncbi:MAG: hypothetical protein H7Y11_12435, partial [Armatimonadetes bacterium]|nr:hypothetical protein [Anaerolineae bacterium]
TKTLVIDQTDNPIKRERFAQVTSAPAANFADTLLLISHDMPQTNIASGDALSVNLYWRLVGESISADYTTVVTLNSADGVEYAQWRQQQPGGLATQHWLPGYYLQDRLTLPTAAGLAPGVYTLSVAVYDPASGRTLDVLDAVGNPANAAYILAPIQVQPPDAPFAATAVAQGPPVNRDLGDGLRLVSFNPLPKDVTVGQALDLAWVWQTVTPQADEPALSLLWLGGESRIRVPITPFSGYPLMQWRAGDLYQARTRITVPAELTSGQVTLRVIVGEYSVPLGVLRVSAPERTFTLPTPQFSADVAWANGIRLLGYDLNADGRPTFYWQTAAPLNTSWQRFVHIVNAYSVIVTQSAGVPADASRPTPGWALGEIITDTVAIAVPNDPALRVYVGWFDPVSGQRVLLTTDADFWALPLPAIGD